MSARNLSLATALSGAVAALAFGLAYTIDSEVVSYLVGVIGVVVTLVFALAAARRIEADPVRLAVTVVLLVVLVAVIALILLVGYLAVECQVYDNCPVN
jgi:hypothetical protein